MKKLILGLCIYAGLAGVVGAFDVSGCQEKIFTMTAYYSPEIGQSFYYKPTFEAEVTLNGQGYFGASGKKVFNGMLAGPASYPFGTVMYFPGLGVGEIADRGGAIVLSGEKGQKFDRIDVWMGRGEEGLIRALTFGKQNMTGYLCGNPNTKVTTKDTLLRDNVPVLKYFFDVALRIQQLEEGRNDIWTRTLQKYLVKLGYLNKKYRNGQYESHTKRALCSYQVAKKIVSSKNPDCGTFGQMTRSIMKLDVKNKGLLPDSLYAVGNVGPIIELAKYYNGKPNESTLVVSSAVEKGNPSSVKSTDNKVDMVTVVAKPKIFFFYKAYAKGQQSSEIKILQNFLQEQGLYSGKIDGVYSKATTNAVYEFQKKYTLISDTDPLLLRGFLGPKTRSKINEIRQK